MPHITRVHNNFKIKYYNYLKITKLLGGKLYFIVSNSPQKTLPAFCPMC